MITFYLCSEGLLSRPVLYLSEYFKRNRTAYFDELHAYHEADAILEWLKFFFEGVGEVAEQAIVTCRKVTSLRERDMSKISAMGRSAANGIVALKHLFRSPFVTVGSIETATGLSRTNANKLVARLVEAGVLYQSDESVAYGRTFFYRDYVYAFL